MKPELKNELERLRQILESNGLKLTLNEGVAAEKIAEVKRKSELRSTAI